MKTYVFPGQGSQIKGMGATIFNEFPELIEKADAILGYSIKTLCLEDPENKLNLTQYTQPALYIVNALTYFKKVREINTQPEFLAGHSLGEYNAILGAGGFDFETGLRLVKKRGELMGKASGGAMAAVIRLKEEKIKEILSKNKFTGIDIANLNTPTQIVISGYNDDILRAKPYFEREGAAYIPLNVSAAFHSRYMQEAKDKFEKYLMNFTFSELSIPVISNVTGKPYDSSNIVSNLANQLRSSVRWTESIKYLLCQGNMEFEELGPGTVLTNLIAKIKAEIPPVQQEKQVMDVLVEKNSKFSPKNDLITNKMRDSTEEDIEGKIAYKQKMEDTYRKIKNWNKKYPIGTKVICQGYKAELKTRSEAMLLFGHRAAIYVENYNGYFALDEITPV
ncbi:[acyl-carrier-protein] S-malonyltransferase [Bacillus atrophaeus]|uniref:ACP S-malonyltransferase n=1 Tax=Bacillus atrophaeus TaxID=1452 RepID=UPI000D084340|nr:ACP S-malonyltransferase [Bacillus atrophaeus]MCY8910321.1 ACP S-malonyltransferase [Bacillus atrophaeus]MEC0835924.1 ACP S-malonyltransferase [Bacillus atrophaeus]MEC0847026.1 ACP S-malonyltransferase [Bacillus atrophaeus]MEC0848341.1 ACP S-malonyltransferase [Bacillus atrophaeus]MEC0864800.1 ACP S-malonyltransferase [Bacillus atrophaeus]